MNNNFIYRRHIAGDIARCLRPAAIGLIVILLTRSPLLAQYDVKNDRILSPEVSHFTGLQELGVDAQGDLHLSIPVLQVPGRDGLSFGITAAYRSGIKVAQSASWIGLGWELDLGSITRQPLGGLDNQIQADWAGALTNEVISQPDVYSVNLQGNSALLISAQLNLTPPPAFPYEPAKSETVGPCSGSDYKQKNFIPTPWRPWKICANGASAVQIDNYTTGCAGGSTRNDISYFTITTEDGTRYVFKLPTLSTANLPAGRGPAQDCSNASYQFVSTWRLTAILSSNYSGPDIPDATSTDGWVKIVYRTWDESLLPSQETDSNAKEVDTLYDNLTIRAQITYPYYVETPTHFAVFKTSKRYDRDLTVLLNSAEQIGYNQNYYNRKLDKIKLFKKTSYLGVPIVLQTGQSVENYGAQIEETSFQYSQNGADSLWAYSNSRQGQMLSKLTLTAMTKKGINGANNLALPSYKFLYYDVKDLNPNTPNPYLSWWDVLNQDNRGIFVFQDDFGFFDPPFTSPFYSSRLEA